MDPAELEGAQAIQAAQWTTRFGDLLADHPEADAELRALVAEIQAAVPVTATDHSVAAGRDLSVQADHGGGRRRGCDSRRRHVGSYQAGSGEQLAGPGFSGPIGAGSAVASHFGTAIGQYVSSPRPEPVSLPVSLPPRSEMLAGREGLLADLHTLLAGGDGPWPRIVVLCGLGGVGKTSVAVEYAHRNLAEVAVARQLAAEDQTVLAAEFGALAAQLGFRGAADGRAGLGPGAGRRLFPGHQLDADGVPRPVPGAPIGRTQPGRGCQSPRYCRSHPWAGIVPVGARHPIAAGHLRLLACMAPEPTALAVLLAGGTSRPGLMMT